MEKLSLHIALKKAIEQFGIDVLNEKKLPSILSDYGAFAEVPATRSIFKEMLEDGYCSKICDLGKKKRSLLSSLFSKGASSIEKPEGEDWRNKLDAIIYNVVQTKGYQQSFVEYIAGSIVYALGWNDDAPAMSSSTGAGNTAEPNKPQSQSPIPYPINNKNTSGSNPNKTNSVTYQQIDDTQFLVMNVSPADAEVYIDGKQQFVSNGIMAVELQVGCHAYEVKADLHETQTGTIDITPNDKTTLDVFLSLEPKIVELFILSSNKGSEIYINGTFYAYGKWNGLVNVGTYNIECRCEKFYPYSITIDLRQGENKTISIPPLKPICGNLKINIQPYGSDIFIDGENKGTTPMLVKGIQIGAREIKVEPNNGGKVYVATVDVRENQITDVNHIIPSPLIKDRDYKDVQIGDYFYADGSTSHSLAKGKKVVGVVFSLETSYEEKQNGWTHGQIIALEDAQGSGGESWGNPTREILQYAISYPTYSTEDKGYKVTHLKSVFNNHDFNPFISASQYGVRLPNGLTSGWYLPSIIQWRNFYLNTYRRLNEIWPYLNIIGSRGYTDYATSSIINSNIAWIYRTGRAKEYMVDSFIAQDIKRGWTRVRAVASF